MSTGPTGTADAAHITVLESTGTSVTDVGNLATTSPAAEIDRQAPPKFLCPNFEGIPVELRQLKSWVLWVPIWTGAKWIKRPIQPSGHGASTTNPKHWSSFEDVKRAYEDALRRGYIELRNKDKLPEQVTVGGVGFVFDGPVDEHGLVFAGVDFDKVVSGKEVTSLALERIKRLGSYTERSVSGTGLHVIVKAKPLQSGVAHDGVEVYTSGRFFTMTGRSVEYKEIISAPDALALLAEEVRAQANSSHAQNGNSDSEQAADAEPNEWFQKLPPDRQSEVIKYAALHIAKTSKLFELTKNGGNYAEYFKLTLAIARSGVPDAADIFVEAASIVKEADPEEKLRDFFHSSEQAESRSDGITVGTLLHTASQCGADFSQWKQIALASDADVALFVPGNEENCRERLARVVAADLRTYTLGDPTGPLVVLRVPEKKDELPAGTRWEGDLPGTTFASPADVMQRAERLRWMKRGKFGLYRVHPPRSFVSDWLTQKLGEYGARPLRGIVRVPRIDDKGEIHFISGYDQATGLYHDRSPTFDVPEKPSPDQVRAAVDVLLYPFSKYHFDDPIAGQALLLAAAFTSIQRPFLSLAPMLVVRSPMPGTGKGRIVSALFSLAYDTKPISITWGGNCEEFEKRLGAVLLRTPGVLSIDNANGVQIKGDLLESVITEGCTDIRVLGESKTVRVRNRSFIVLTGNNPIITGDMARRALSVDILPRSADPERDHYPFDPAELVQRRRDDFLSAAFIAMRAFRFAGMPSQGLPAVGSFDEWSRKVRDLVYYLTAYDIAEGFRRNKAEDPRRQNDAALLAALHQHFGTNPFDAAQAIAVHKRVATQRRSSLTITTTASAEALHDALEEVLGSRDVNPKLFGYWARRVRGARMGGFMLETNHNAATNANDITVQRV